MAASTASLAHPEFLVETDWLAAHLGVPELCVIDCTVHIASIRMPNPVTRLRRGGRISSAGTFPAPSLSTS